MSEEQDQIWFTSLKPKRQDYIEVKTSCGDILLVSVFKDSGSGISIVLKGDRSKFKYEKIKGSK